MNDYLISIGVVIAGALIGIGGLLVAELYAWWADSDMKGGEQ